MSKSKTKNRRKFLFGVVLTILLIVWIIYTLLNQRALRSNLEAKRTEYESEISDLENDIEVLKKEISNSNSLQFVETVAREELGMVKPREIIVIDKNKKRKKGFRLNTPEN